MSQLHLLTQTDFDPNYKVYIIMDFGNKHKDFKSMTLDGQYNGYNEQTPTYCPLPTWILVVVEVNFGKECKPWLP